MSSSRYDLDSEVEWFGAELGVWLDKYSKITRVTSFSKRWWNDKIVQTRKTQAREKKRLGTYPGTTEELKKA